MFFSFTTKIIPTVAYASLFQLSGLRVKKGTNCSHVDDNQRDDPILFEINCLCNQYIKIYVVICYQSGCVQHGFSWYVLISTSSSL